MVRHAAALHQPQLPVVAESLELAVAADADATAGLHDLVRDLRFLEVRILLLHEPAAPEFPPPKLPSHAAARH